MVLHCPRHFSRPSTSSSVHLNLFAFSILFFTVSLLLFSVIPFTVGFFQNRYVCLRYQSYATIFVWFLCHCACTNSFLSRDKPLFDRATLPQLGWPVSWKRDSSASERTRFQIVDILFQISVIAELYLKIDFPLNDSASSQPPPYIIRLQYYVLRRNNC